MKPLTQLIKSVEATISAINSIPNGEISIEIKTKLEEIFKKNKDFKTIQDTNSIIEKLGI